MAIFVNYRRQDSPAITGRIDDHLRHVFGAKDVYRDVDNIPPGVDFARHIEEALRQCDVCVAIIGPAWNPGRLSDSKDFVRLELETLIEHEVPIIPVLVEGAAELTSEGVPKSLLPLLAIQWVRIDSGGDFKIQVGRLVTAIRKVRKRPNSVLAWLFSSPVRVAAASVSLLALVGGASAWAMHGPSDDSNRGSELTGGSGGATSRGPASGNGPTGGSEPTGGSAPTAGTGSFPAHAQTAGPARNPSTTPPTPQPSAATPECKVGRCPSPGVSQSCLSNGKWGPETKCATGFCNGSGECGECAADTFSCPSQIGLLCSERGKWITNNTNAPCHCTAPVGRFLKSGQDSVSDTKTSLTWDSIMQPAATWADAGQICEKRKMRLPTMAEWRGLIIPVLAAKDAHCAPGTALNASPFDDAAFPGEVVGRTKLWTGTPEHGFPGFVLVAILAFDQKSGWTVMESDDKPTTLHAYRCVKETPQRRLNVLPLIAPKAQH